MSNSLKFATICTMAIYFLNSEVKQNENIFTRYSILINHHNFRHLADHGRRQIAIESKIKLNKPLYPGNLCPFVTIQICVQSDANH